MRFTVRFEHDGAMDGPTTREFDTREEAQAALDYLEEQDAWPEGHDAVLTTPDGQHLLYLGAGEWEDAS